MTYVTSTETTKPVPSKEPYMSTILNLAKPSEMNLLGIEVPKVGTQSGSHSISAVSKGGNVLTMDNTDDSRVYSTQAGLVTMKGTPHHHWLD